MATPRELLDDLIATLSGSNATSLADALLKTKVLLHKLGRKELVEWVSHELEGYPDATAVPAYRVIDGDVRGNITAGDGRALRDHPLPTMHLDAKLRARYEKLELRESVAALTELADTNKAGELRRLIPVEAIGFFQEKIAPGWYVQNCWSAVGHGQLAQVLTQVRSRLLDFVLELSEKVETKTTDAELKQLGSREETRAMFANAVIGDNATFVIGNQNVTTISNQVVRGDFQSLAAELRKNGVDESDIQSLNEAIVLDGPLTSEAKPFGQRVSGWVRDMVGKAIDGTWQVELNIAASLLWDLLKSFYG